jgi:hypothetical protein
MLMNKVSQISALLFLILSATISNVSAQETVVKSDNERQTKKTKDSARLVPFECSPSTEKLSDGKRDPNKVDSYGWYPPCDREPSY